MSNKASYRTGSETRLRLTAKRKKRKKKIAMVY